MSIVDDAIEDCVGDGRLPDHIMPGRHRKLGGDQCGFATIPFLEDFEKIEALLVIEAVSAPVIQDKQLDPGKLVHHAREATVETRKSRILEHARHAQI